MARPRKPESQLSPDSVAHNKGLYAARDREPKAKGELGGPSRWLNKEQKKIWKLLVKNSPAVLGESDRPLLEIAVVLKSQAGSSDYRERSDYTTHPVSRQVGSTPEDAAGRQAETRRGAGQMGLAVVTGVRSC
jgi:hypothetical protein